MAVPDADRPLGASARLVQNLHVLTRHGSFGRVLIAATGTRLLTLRGTGTDVCSAARAPSPIDTARASS